MAALGGDSASPLDEDDIMHGSLVGLSIVLIGLVGFGLMAIRFGVDSRPVERHRPNL